VKLDKEAGKSIWEVEEEIHKRRGFIYEV